SIHNDVIAHINGENLRSLAISLKGIQIRIGPHAGKCTGVFSDIAYFRINLGGDDMTDTLDHSLMTDVLSLNLRQRVVDMLGKWHECAILSVYSGISMEY